MTEPTVHPTTAAHPSGDGLLALAWAQGRIEEAGR